LLRAADVSAEVDDLAAAITIESSSLVGVVQAQVQVAFVGESTTATASSFSRGSCIILSFDKVGPGASSPELPL